MRFNLGPGRRSKKQKTIAVISNQNAGKGTPRAGLGRVVGSILTTPHWHYDTATLGELDTAAREIQLERPDIVAIVGGDGTIHQFLSRMLREHEDADSAALPHFLIIPTGTMNNVAASLGLTGQSAVDLAKRIAGKIAAQKESAPLNIAHANAIRVNDEFGFLYGSGLPVNFLQEYYKGGENLGPRRALEVILHTLWDEFLSLLPIQKSKKILTRPVHAKVTLPEGFDPPVAPFMTHTGLMVASVDQVGMGCRGMPLAQSRLNHFMVRSTILKFWGLAANAGAIWAGVSPIAKTFDAVVPKVTVEYEQPTVTTIDGDLKPPTLRDVISCGPLLKFITG